MDNDLSIETYYYQPEPANDSNGNPRKGLFTSARTMSYGEVRRQINGVLAAIRLPDPDPDSDSEHGTRSGAETIEWLAMASEVIGPNYHDPAHEDILVPDGTVWVSTGSGGSEGRIIRMEVFKGNTHTGSIGTIKMVSDRAWVGAIRDVLVGAFENGDFEVRLAPELGGQPIKDKLYRDIYPLGEPIPPYPVASHPMR